MNERILRCVSFVKRISSCECNDWSTTDYRRAQAVELLRALRHQLHEMTTQLAWVEGQGVSHTTRGCAMRLEAELKALGAVAYVRAWESNCYWVISTRTSD